MEPPLRTTIWSRIIHKTFWLMKENEMFYFRRYFYYYRLTILPVQIWRKIQIKLTIVSIIYVQNVIGKISERCQIMGEGQHSNIPIALRSFLFLQIIWIVSNIILNIYRPVLEITDTIYGIIKKKRISWSEEALGVNGCLKLTFFIFKNLCFFLLIDISKIMSQKRDYFWHK